MGPNKVWLITGCSSGLGKDLTLEVLSRGDNVISTGRDISRLRDVQNAGAHILQLDVTDTLENLTKVIEEEAVKVYGRIDILVNNAGYISCGVIEELSPEETVNQFNTNVFGLLNVTRAVLPHFRARKSGAILNLSSVGGWIGIPACGSYCASKWAIEGFSEALHGEVAPLGIKVLVVAPGYFRTSLLDPTKNISLFPQKFKDYDAVRQSTSDLFEAANGKQPGDPKKGVKAIVDVVKGEREWPMRLLLGSDAVEAIKGHCESVIKEIDAWADVSRSCDFPKEI